jgi:DNA-binding transcriptional regulator GbsR (MarR family)
MENTSLENEIIEFFQAATKLQGGDESLGTIFGILYTEPSEISMEDLAKKTGYSLASICNKVRMFETTGMIKRSRKPHTKKIFVSVEKDCMQMIKKIMLMKQESVIKLAKEKIPQLIKKYSGKKLGPEQKQKLRLMENYHGEILKLEKITTEMLKKIDELERMK